MREVHETEFIEAPNVGLKASKNKYNDLMIIKKKDTIPIYASIANLRCVEKMQGLF